MKKQLLRFQGVKMIYHTKNGETTAAEDLTFSVDEGEFVAIIGPSGCGKTTLLSLAAGLLTPSEGAVENEGISFGYMLQKDEGQQAVRRGTGRDHRTHCETALPESQH